MLKKKRDPADPKNLREAMGMIELRRNQAIKDRGSDPVVNTCLGGKEAAFNEALEILGRLPIPKKRAEVHWRGRLVNRRAKVGPIDMQSTACGRPAYLEVTNNPAKVTCEMCRRSVTFKEHQRRVGEQG